MIDLQIAFMESLEKQQAFDKPSAVLFGKIKDNASLPVGQAQLTWARNKSFIDYHDKEGLKYYFLSKKGMKYLNDFFDRNPTQECKDEPQCPASVGGDIDPDESRHDQENNNPENNGLHYIDDINAVAGQINVYTEENNSMLDEPLDISEPEYDQDAVAFNQHTDSFINVTNEPKQIKEIVEYVITDKDQNIVDDSFETLTDAIHKAHELAATGATYTVERIATRKMGIAKPITTTQWVAA